MRTLQEGLLSPNLILGKDQLLRSIPRVKTEDGTCSRLPFSFIFPFMDNVFLVIKKKKH
jgi:hypothetical protein